MRGSASRFRPESICDFMDAAYDLDADDQSWTLRVLESARAVWGRGGPGQGAIYDASKVEALALESFQTIDFSNEGIRWLERAITMFTPASVAGTFRSQLVGSSSSPR